MRTCCCARCRSRSFSRWCGSSDGRRSKWQVVQGLVVDVWWRWDGWDLAVAGWGGMKLRSEYPGTTAAAGQRAVAWTQAGDPRADRGAAWVARRSEGWEVVEVRSAHRSGGSDADRSRMGVVTRARESLAVTAASAVAAVALFLLM